MNSSIGGHTMSKETPNPLLRFSFLVTAAVALTLVAMPDSDAMSVASGGHRGGGPEGGAAGTVCLDAYEASVWRVPNPTTTNALLVRKLRQGTATTHDLTLGGARRLGGASDDYAPCADSGQNCTGDIYAASLPSELPSGN